jgi:hypothetical protein
MSILRLGTKSDEVCRFVIVDEEDYEWAKDWKWFLNQHGYAARNGSSPERGMIFLHHCIAGRPLNKLEIDHRNHCRFDNRRSNLRFATHRENLRNVSVARNSPYGVTGVTWDSKRIMWRSRVQMDGKLAYFGRFLKFEDAVRARKQAELRIYGEFAPI